MNDKTGKFENRWNYALINQLFILDIQTRMLLQNGENKISATKAPIIYTIFFS